ncbi:MAG: metal-sulfur cluster assembly factor [Muribaculaceae bacterium]|nr:metal-sulfur cluster assembly factor [Muribaculaceae bacterium]
MLQITPDEKLNVESKAVQLLQTVFDPEIPVDVYSLGLIYRIEFTDQRVLQVDMTLTAPSCPAADFLVDDARLKLETIPGVKNVEINIVFEPEWTQDMMSDEAKLELGFL